MAPISSNRLALLLAIALPLGCGCGDETEPDGKAAAATAATAATATPVPPRAESKFQNAAVDVDYVGSQQCVTCHADQHATWKTSSHAKSMTRVTSADEPPDAKFEHRKSGRVYEVARVESSLHHRESMVLNDGTLVPLSDHPLDFLVGSGRFSRTYLVELDGSLIESPITWYTQRQAWDMSPGYDHSIHRSFRRRATHSCLLCHAGLVEPVEPRGFTFPHNELSIGCERCHGPGSRHVAGHTEPKAELLGDRPVDLTIVNPSRLDRPLAEAICQQCHLQADVKVTVRGRRPGDFRPGLPLSDERIEFRLVGSGPEMTVVGHVDQLQESRCYQQDNSLSCVTCHDSHDPHRPQDSITRARRARTNCLQCHGADDCGETQAARAATRHLADSCAACHMPEVDTDIPHIAFTHHRIAVHETSKARTSSDSRTGLAADGELKTIQDLSRFSAAERDRMLGLGYYRLHFQRPWQHARFLVRAEGLLRRAAREIRGDAVLDAARAEIAWEAKQVAAADRGASQVLDAEHVDAATRAVALHVKVQVLMQRGKLALAIPLLEELTTSRRDPLDWALLGHCRSRTGKLPEAIAAFEKALTIAPGQGSIHRALVPLYERTGDSDQAKTHREKARQLPSNGFAGR
jgi:hypothetical protein